MVLTELSPPHMAKDKYFHKLLVYIYNINPRTGGDSLVLSLTDNIIACIYRKKTAQDTIHN